MTILYYKLITNNITIGEINNGIIHKNYGRNNGCFVNTSDQMGSRMIAV